MARDCLSSMQSDQSKMVNYMVNFYITFMHDELGFCLISKKNVVIFSTWMTTGR